MAKTAAPSGPFPPSTLLTIKQVAAGFSISTVALSHWRAGTKALAPLKLHTEAPPRFRLSTVESWAKKHSRSFDQDAAMLPAMATTKPGPKAKPAEEKKQGKGHLKGKRALHKGTKSKAAKTVDVAPEPSAMPSVAEILDRVAKRKPAPRNRAKKPVATQQAA